MRVFVVGLVHLSIVSAFACSDPADSDSPRGPNDSLGQADASSSSQCPVAPDGSSVQVGGLFTVSAGGNHTCAVTSAGGVRCWGDNRYGQLGSGPFESRSAPVDVSPLTGITSIDAGLNHTCALTAAGGVKCWGYNKNGELGDGSIVDREGPVDVVGLGSGVKAITAGQDHACALLSAGTVKCWGYNNLGQIGDNSTSPRPAPVDVVGLTDVTAISAGTQHTCALMADHRVKCWGANVSGELGDGSEVGSRSTPVDVVGLVDATAISAGRQHTCALTTAGGVKCWGNNTLGQLGGNPSDRYFAPVDIPTLATGVAAIAAGHLHTCVVTTSGGAKCWGYNVTGQLGDDSTFIRRTPVDVVGLTAGVTQITAGGQHSCAASGGGVKCWGDNAFGQLGDDSTTPRLTPVAVGALEIVITSPPTPPPPCPATVGSPR